MGSNPYTTPPWTFESPLSDMTHLGMDDILQETVGSDRHLAPAMSPVDEFSSSLLSPILTSRLSTLPTQQLPYTQPTAETSTKVLSISTAFNLGAFPAPRQPDTVLVSSDETFFYVHGKVLSNTSIWFAIAGNTEQSTSSNRGSSTLSEFSIYPCPLPQESEKVWLKITNITADELNVILHALYNTSCANHRPTVGTLNQAIDKMASLLGISVNTVVCPGNEVYNYLLAIMPLHPLRIYALAAHHKIHTMAVRSSSHLLAYPIGSISDEECERMGAIYLRKLVVLQVERKERLITLLLSPPRPHLTIHGCGQGEPRLVEALWAGVLVNLTYDLRADVSAAVLQRTFEPLTTKVSSCPQCVDSIQTRIGEMLRSWVSMKHTI